MRSLLLLFFLVITSALAAQTVTLYGNVVDARTREPLIGATVQLEGTSIGTVTDIDGNYRLPGVAPGSYSLSAGYLGYASTTRTNLTVTSKGNDDINFALDESSTDLEVVTVTASPFQTKTSTPLSLQSLSPEEIKTYPGGNNDIAKVVQSLPGVSGSVGGFRNDVIIRGGAPNENVYYLDGIEIPNINHFATQGSAGGPAGLLNVDFIEGVELSASAFGAQYDNPLSGVLQFDQRTGNARRRQTNLRISASEAALTTEGPLDKGEAEAAKTTYLLSVRRSYLQFLFELIDLPIRPDYWDYQFKLNHEIDAYNTVYLTGVGSIDDFSVSPPDSFDIEQQATLEQVPIIEQRTVTVGLGWRSRLKAGKGIMRTTLSSNGLSNQFSRYEDNENKTGLILRNDSREIEQKLRYAYTRFVNRWSLTAGANLTRATYTNDTEDFVFNNTFSTDIDFWKYGLFAQASTTSEDGRLGVSAGFRVDANTFTTTKNQLLRTFSPRASISYVLDEAEKWRASATVGKYYKIAPYTILGFQDAAGNFANQDVDYIGSLHGVVGLEYRLGAFSKLSAETFYKRYTDYPVSVEEGVSLANLGGDFSVLGNEAVETSGTGRTFGLELLFQQKLTKNFYAILAYTLFSSEFTGLDGVRRPSVWDSRQLISFTGGYQLRGNWEISGRYRFAGRTPFAPLDEAATLQSYPVLLFDYDRLGTAELAAFNQLDIRIDKKWNFNAFALNVFIDVTNVLGQETPAPPSYGLDRDETGALITPRSLIIIPVTASSAIPTLGLAVDF